MGPWHERLGLFLLLIVGLFFAGVGCSSDDALEAVPTVSGPALVMLYSDN